MSAKSSTISDNSYKGRAYSAALRELSVRMKSLSEESNTNPEKAHIKADGIMVRVIRILAEQRYGTAVGDLLTTIADRYMEVGKLYGDTNGKTK